MKAYQQEYLALLRTVQNNSGPQADGQPPEAFVAAAAQANRIARQAVEQGTRLLREQLFPLLDNVLSASRAEIDSLQEFAAALMSGTTQKDVGLYYRIHLALMSYARQRGERDMLIRELYFTGMALYNLETMLAPNKLRLYATRMRLYFAESARYFETEYDAIQDPETRGYIHRSMGNIALSYDGRDPASAQAKLAVCTRSIRVLSDPDVRAKTPSLPWDLFLYKSHQERTTLLSFLRSGLAGPDAFAEVLESAQTVQERQLQAARERGEPLQPRWQYAYMAARYHCGAMLLPELLDGLYSLAGARADDDFGLQSMFSHVSVPAIYLEYMKQLEPDTDLAPMAARVARMTRRLCAWITRAPNSDDNEQLMFYIRQFVYAYRELTGGMPFIEVLQNVFAARHPAIYARMWIAGQIARQLTLWAVEDCPEALVGLPGCDSAGDVLWQREALAQLATQAGTLYDVGMVHFLNLDASACRGLFEEEALLQLHAYCGAELLSQHPSTSLFADIARGHHCAWDEKSGYPVDFAPSESPMKAMIYLVAVADALCACAADTFSRYRPAQPFAQVWEELQAGEGKRYAPFAVALLRPEQRRAALEQKLETWRREAYLDMYRRRAQAVAEAP